MRKLRAKRVGKGSWRVFKYVSIMPIEARRGCQVPLELELEALVGLQLWLLGTKLVLCTTVHTLKHRVIIQHRWISF